jgi:tetraacyldisaccharide 4'-kinase
VNVLTPLSFLYALGVSLHRDAAMVGEPTFEHPHITSIGNLEAGGNGKTPLAMWILARMSAQGKSCAYVSRGYGGVHVSKTAVTCVLAQNVLPASMAGLRVIARTNERLARAVGDEGAMVCERVPLVSAFFCRDKVRAVRTATECGADLIVLDDGFQSWRIPRHSDIVLLDAERPLDGGQLLPAGRLRELPSALSRADQIIFNGAATPAAVTAARAQIELFLRPGVLVSGMARRVVLTTPAGDEGRADAVFQAVSAIARPDAFQQSLVNAGVQVAAHYVFRDHHRYEARDIERIVASAREANASAIVTTEKDWVKLRHFEMPLPVWIARLDVSLTEFQLLV